MEPVFVVGVGGIDGVLFVEWDGKRELDTNENPTGEIYEIHPGSVDSAIRLGLVERLTPEELQAYNDKKAADAAAVADPEATKKGKK